MWDASQDQIVLLSGILDLLHYLHWCIIGDIFLRKATLEFAQLCCQEDEMDSLPRQALP